MQPYTRIYYSSVLLIAEHVSSDTPLMIRSSHTVTVASAFTHCNKEIKPEAVIRVFELLMMSGVSLETC